MFVHYFISTYHKDKEEIISSPILSSFTIIERDAKKVARQAQKQAGTTAKDARRAARKTAKQAGEKANKKAKKAAEKGIKNGTIKKGRKGVNGRG